MGAPRVSPLARSTGIRRLHHAWSLRHRSRAVRRILRVQRREPPRPSPAAQRACGLSRRRLAGRRRRQLWHAPAGVGSQRAGRDQAAHRARGHRRISGACFARDAASGKQRSPSGRCRYRNHGPRASMLCGTPTRRCTSVSARWTCARCQRSFLQVCLGERYAHCAGSMSNDDTPRMNGAAASAILGSLILRSISLAAGVSLVAIGLAALLSIR